MCGGRSSILHYGPLIETNYLYAPTPNGQSPSASLNKSNTPLVELSIYFHVYFSTEKEVGAMEEAHDAIIWDLAWHPLGHVLASASNDHST